MISPLTTKLLSALTVVQFVNLLKTRFFTIGGLPKPFRRAQD